MEGCCAGILSFASSPQPRPGAGVLRDGQASSCRVPTGGFVHVDFIGYEDLDDIAFGIYALAATATGHQTVVK